MSSMKRCVLGLLAVAGLGVPAAQAGGWSVGVNIGAPVYYRPYPYYYRPYGWYRPYPTVYVGVPPVVVEPAPVVQAVPVVQPVYAAPAPAQAPAPARELAPTPTTPTTVRAVSAQPGQADVNHHLQMLADADERVRSDSVMQLGRLKATQAIDPLAATLAGDRSATVREAAARALGLIGSPNALPALQRAAQVDNDRDVRRSAQFALEVIQSR
jgi:HEAT repeats